MDLCQAQQMSDQWTLEMDAALVIYVNQLCQHLAVSTARLHPHEVYLSEADLSSMGCACLQGTLTTVALLRHFSVELCTIVVFTFFRAL